MKNFLILAFVLLAISLGAQVETNIIKDIDFRQYVKGHVPNAVVEHQLFKPDVKKVLKEDKTEENRIPRFAIKIPVSLSERDGEFIETTFTINWKIAIFANEATSLNFQFKDLNLPEEAEMYIYSQNKRMVIGPITEKNIHGGVFASDMLYGSHAIIEVVMPRKSLKKGFSLKISSFSYGILPNAFVESSFRDFGDALDCNNDINCAVGDPWADVRDGIARIQVGGEKHCSGSLVTDECESGRPYFLTAFHCFEGNEDLTDWTFQFFYESLTCDGAKPTTWVTFSGADFRAGWDDSDFLLLELLNPTGIEGNTVSHVPNADVNDDLVACIHHPEGDAKKISLDGDGLGITGNNWVVEQWDDGVVQHASSGGPLFDEQHFIIGQVLGGDDNIGCSDGGGLVDNGTFGRTNVSWLGGGTNETSLEPWLGSGLPPDDQYSIGGPNLLCGRNVYSISFDTGDDAFWETTFDAEIDDWSGLALIKPQGNYSGPGTIRFSGEVDYFNCWVDIERFKDIWVGIPPTPIVNYSTCKPYVDLWLLEESFAKLADVSSIKWEVWGEIAGTPNYYEEFNDIEHVSLSEYSDLYYYIVTLSNDCGESTMEGYIPFDKDDCDEKYEKVSVSPNPVHDNLHLSLNPAFTHNGGMKKVKIHDQFGNVKLQMEMIGNELEIDISHLKVGQYFLLIVSQGEVATQKFIKM